MQTHYFQRYHSKENVATANAMLLISRLYLYSSNEFFLFLKQILCEKIQEPNIELRVNLQEKGNKSVLDASIVQESFKIAVETKLYNNFYLKQLESHLETLKSGYKYAVLLTLDPQELSLDKEKEIAEMVQIFNEKNQCDIKHIHMTFQRLIETVRSVVNERDTEMIDIIDDFEKYAYSSNLLPDDWKTMRMVLVGTTFDENIDNKLYYHGLERGYSPHKYIGLYKDKSIQAIGEIEAIVARDIKDGIAKVKIVQGKMPADGMRRIEKAIEDGEKKHGYKLKTEPHIFFLVKNFYQTDFRKVSPGGSIGSKHFDLCEVLVNHTGKSKYNKELPETKDIADLLRNITWR